MNDPEELELFLDEKVFQTLVKPECDFFERCESSPVSLSLVDSGSENEVDCSERYSMDSLFPEMNLPAGEDSLWSFSLDSSSSIGSLFGNEQVTSSPVSSNQSSPQASPVYIKLEPDFEAQVKVETKKKRGPKETKAPKLKAVKKEENCSNEPRTSATSKKRRPQFDPVPESFFMKDGKPKELSSDDLVKLDGEQIEVYISALQCIRSFSPAEEKELKRIRRLIKNREYAQSSRNKRKSYMDDIEQEVNDLKKDTKALGDKVNHLEEENNALRSQLLQIGEMLKGTDNEIVKKVLEITASLQEKSQRPVKKARTGVTVMILLFTMVFSIFFTFSGSSTIFHSIQPSFTSASSPGHTSRTLLFDNNKTSSLEIETPTLFQQYAPVFLQTWVAKLNTKHMDGTTLDLQSESNCESFVGFQRSSPGLIQKPTQVRSSRQENLTTLEAM